MPKSKTEKIELINTEIQQLKNRQKKLVQQQKEEERKLRTRRLCKRAGLLESMLPETVSLTDEQFKTYLEKTLTTNFSQEILREIKTQTKSLSYQAFLHMSQ